MSNIIGVDYSLTSPAVCVHSGEEWSFDNCKFYYFVKNEKSLNRQHPFYATLYPDYHEDVDRFNNLMEWVVEIVKNHNVDKCYIEGYAFGAVGRVFQIAENAGLLKHSLWKMGVQVDVIAPTMIKKFATTKGNANKESMYNSFFIETAIDIREKIGIINQNQWNPLSDIVDSYFIAKYGFAKEAENGN